MICNDFERLIDYADGLLSPLEADSTSKHLAGGCRRCGDEIDWYGRLKAIASSDDSVEPPAWVFNRAVRAFGLRRPGAGLRERVGKLIASLAFDSFGRAALAGVRAAETSERQLLYRAHPYSIDVKITPLDLSQAGLTGQILREGEMKFESVAGLSLMLIRDGLTILTTATNDTGEFTMEGLDKGQYELRIDALESSITIVGLPVA